MSKLIRGQVRSFFRADCSKCRNVYNCFPASGINRSIAEYIDYCRGVRPAPTKAMLIGRELHMRELAPHPTADEYGMGNLKDDIVKGKTIALKEVRVCSKTFGYRGMIDYLELQLRGNYFKVLIRELKPRFTTDYLYQLIIYAKIFTDPQFEFIYEKITKKGKRIFLGESILPINLPVNAYITIELKTRDSTHIWTKPWMIANTLNDWSNGIAIAVTRKVKDYVSTHPYGLYAKEDFEKMILKNSGRQLHMGKRKLLVKHRPYVHKPTPTVI